MIDENWLQHAAPRIKPAGPDSRQTQILRVACTMPETFTREDLTVECWKAFPVEFGFAASDGISRPKSSAVLPRVDGSVGLIARGYLDWATPGLLTVTKRGRIHARSPEEQKTARRGQKSAGSRRIITKTPRTCSWCAEPATHKDEEGDDAYGEHRSEAAAKKARKRRAVAAEGLAVLMANGGSVPGSVPEVNHG